MQVFCVASCGGAAAKFRPGGTAPVQVEVAAIRRFLEAILLLGSARGCGLIVTLVRQKVLSIVLGPSGMGLLALLRQFLDPLIQILPLGINAGVVRFVAKYRGEGDERGLRATISTAAWFFLAISSAAALMILIFSRPLAVQVLGRSAYRHLIVLAGLSLPMTIFAAYFSALLVGAERIKTITCIHYIGHAVTLIVTVPLIILYKLTGAVVGIVVLELYYCGAFGLMAGRYLPLNLERFSPTAILRLASYGAATLADLGLWTLVFFLARVDFSRRFGDQTQGLFEIVYRLSFNYLAILVFAINSYVFPRISALKDDGGVGAEINTTLRGLWLLLVPIAVVLSIMIKPLIWLFSTREFFDGAAFLPWQLVGDIYFMCWAAMGLALLGRAKLRAFVAVGVGRNAVFLLSYFAIQWLAGRADLSFFPTIPKSLRAMSGWQGLVWAYAASSVAAAALSYLALKRLYRFALTRDNCFLIGFSTVAVMPVVFVPNLGPLWVGAKLAALVIWAAVVVTRAEWSKGLEWIGRLVSGGKEQ